MRNFTLSLLFILLSPLTALAQSDTLYIEKTDGSMLIIPKIYIVEQAETSTAITYTLTGGRTHELAKADIATIHYRYPYAKPRFESFKFNNKFNDQLYTDALGEIDEANGKVNVQVGCIGKRLTPSFKVPDGVEVYANGTLQESKVSRPRFDETVQYTVAYPNQSIYTVKTQAINDTTWTPTQVSLTADMFSTNAPSNHGDDPANMLDGDVNTIFHTTWGSGQYTPLPKGYAYENYPSYWPYLQIELPEPLYNLQFSYTTRANNYYAPLGLILQGSNDGSTWTYLRTFTQAGDNLPTGLAETYTSPVISLSQGYSKFRLQLTSAQHDNYLVFAEFSLYENTYTVTPRNANTYYNVPIDLATGATMGLQISRQPYVQVALPEDACGVSFSYTPRYKGDVDRDGDVDETDIAAMADLLLYKRSGHDLGTVDMNGDNQITIADLTALTDAVANGTKTLCAPVSLYLQGSTDGTRWTTLRYYSTTSTSSTVWALPTEAGVTYPGQIVEFDTGAYKYVRLLQSNSADYYQFKLSDLRFCYVTHLCEASTQPYGTTYDVEVDFLTDHATTEYAVPRIDITFGDGQTWSSNQWIGQNDYTTTIEQDGYTTYRWNRFYVDATIQIDGAGVFPDMAETAIQIKGRGNSSWGQSYNHKNPYRIKFETSVKPFGMKKGKSWILLANKQTGSMTSNAIAMKVADMVESRGCNHIVPVELYINGQYRGSYNFTEKTGFSNNSIDLVDESNAAFLELDKYYDEWYRFREANYNLPVNIKEPDLYEQVNEIGWLTEDEAQEYMSDIAASFNRFTADTKTGGTQYLDVDAFVRAMLVNDLVRNEECKHPKSWKLYNPDYTNADSLWTFGPVWDFDWSYGYDNGNYDYFIHNAEDDLFANMTSSNVGYPFFRDLLRKSDTVKRAYYLLWKNFMESGKLDELIEYCDDYFEYAKPSFEHNYIKWSDGNQYSTTTANAKSWLKKRANYIYNNLEKYDE